MSRDWKLYALDIRDSVEFLQDTFKNLKKLEQYLTDKRTQLATERAFEIIGEAAKHLPSEIKEKYAHINWRAIIGMRDLLAHGYHKLDDEIIWNTVQKDLEPLFLAVDEMLKK